VAAGKVIKQALRRNTRAHKNRGTTHNLRRARDDVRFDSCVHKSIIPQSRLKSDRREGRGYAPFGTNRIEIKLPVNNPATFTNKTRL
jgi:hypothetical protein